MGQAKQRGTFEERKNQALAKKKNWFQRLIARVKKRLSK